MNATKTARRLKEAANAGRGEGCPSPRPQRFRCFNVLLDRGLWPIRGVHQPFEDEWHLSVSEVCTPSETDKKSLSNLIEALGVPEGKRDGFVAARQFHLGKALPQVRHYTWAPTKDDLN